MHNKKIPLRMCIACKNSKPKQELFRIVKFEDKFNLDLKCKLNGRGAYICNNNSCVQNTIKNKLLNKSFRQNVSNDVYDLLKEITFE
jgi:predicted RNA-binding protein YlxR (DUF448 family)